MPSADPIEIVEQLAAGSVVARPAEPSATAAPAAPAASLPADLALSIVVPLHGDLQNDPRDIVPLLGRYFADPQRDYLGLVIGHRRQRRDTKGRRLASRFANAVRSRVLGERTPDTGCGIKVVRRSAYLALPYFDHMHRFLPALLKRAGYRVASHTVRHSPRIHERAHYGVFDRASAGLVDLLGVAWLMHRSQALHYEEDD